MGTQLPAAVLMVRPAAFGFNPETAEPHWFNKDISEFSRAEISRRARIEFDRLVERLRAASVEVLVTDDTEEPVTPNAVFLNNWVSFHRDGAVVIYPLFAPNRRPERRRTIIEDLRNKGFSISRILDLSHHENEGRFLEGTGSIAFDHLTDCAYASLSARTHPDVLNELCEELHLRPITFRAVDAAGIEIRHTDTMMSLADRFAIVCLESITDEDSRRTVSDGLRDTDREIVPIDHAQRAHFAGNVLQVQTTDGNSVIVMSTAALHAFRPDQRAEIEKYTQIVEAPLSVIEGIEGSSAHSMMAGVYLPRVHVAPGR